MKTSTKTWRRKVLTTSTSSWNGRLSGELSLPEVQRVLENAGVQGDIIRLDTGRGETSVYVATHSKPPRLTKGIKGKMVRLADVTKLR
jgi:hypothetical protein